MQYIPDKVLDISCRSARFERTHTPHMHDDPELGRVQCWGWPPYSEGRTESPKPKDLKDAVKDLKETPNERQQSRERTNTRIDYSGVTRNRTPTDPLRVLPDE